MFIYHQTIVMMSMTIFT